VDLGIPKYVPTSLADFFACLLKRDLPAAGVNVHSSIRGKLIERGIMARRPRKSNF